MADYHASELYPRPIASGFDFEDIKGNVVLTLLGNEEEIVDLLRQMVDAFNATVEYRDPGPSVEVICGVVVDHLTCSMPRGHEGRHFGNLLRPVEAYPGADHYLRMAGLIGADGQPGPIS